MSGWCVQLATYLSVRQGPSLTTTRPAGLVLRCGVESFSSPDRVHVRPDTKLPAGEHGMPSLQCDGSTNLPYDAVLLDSCRELFKRLLGCDR